MNSYQGIGEVFLSILNLRQLRNGQVEKWRMLFIVDLEFRKVAKN
jgi:hypothetical protein